MITLSGLLGDRAKMIDFKQLLELALPEEEYTRIHDMPADLMVQLYPEILTFGPNAVNIQKLVADLQNALQAKAIEVWEKQAARKFRLKSLAYAEHYYSLLLPYDFYNGLSQANKAVVEDCELVLKSLIEATIIIVSTDSFPMENKRDLALMPNVENYFKFFGLKFEDYRYKGKKMSGENPFLVDASLI